jgi:hypothetical protein
MTTQLEWTMIAQDYGRRIKFIETADDYIDRLAKGQGDWRDYYREVNHNVYAKQSDSS